MLITNADFPILGRAAKTIRLPGWKPPVSSSRSLKPVGVPVIERPSRLISSSLSSSSWRTASIERSSPLRSSWAILKSADSACSSSSFGGPGKVKTSSWRGGGEGEEVVRGAAPRRQEAPHQRVVLDDPAVVADVAGRRHHVRQRVDVR